MSDGSTEAGLRPHYAGWPEPGSGAHAFLRYFVNFCLQVTDVQNNFEPD
jgi:hypothetical protein